MTEDCKRLAAGVQWPGAEPGSVFATDGGSFDVTINVLAAGEHPTEPPMLGEEVGAILEGSFHIETSEESFELVKGEAIIIPPGEPRRWTCRDDRGVLYRVIVTAPMPVES
jgi:quercetin dioxygenase-like cupin family protein